MIHRFLFTATVLLALIWPASGQVNCLNSNKLICIIPNQLNLTQQSSNNLAFLNEAIGSQVGDLPLASPASGVIYTNDPKLNTPIASNATLGPILTQRAETIGRGKIYVAFTYQYFNFTDVDGQSLKNLPIYANAPDGSSVTVTNNRLDLKASQFAFYFTYGVASNIDVSVAVPILNVHEQFTTNGTIYYLTPPGPNMQCCKPGDADPIATSHGVVGVGDITFAAKYQAWKPKHGGLALGAELRVPSGDALNFLGTGTIGFRPFATFTYGTRFSPHANIAYEINANSYLVSLVQAGHLPNRLLYSGGVDWGVVKRITVAVDILAQHVYDGQRVRIDRNFTIANSNITASTILPYKQSYTGVYGSGGIKIKPFRNLILTGNVLVSMNEAGFRARIVPMFGASYTFGR